MINYCITQLVYRILFIMVVLWWFNIIRTVENNINVRDWCVHTPLPEQLIVACTVFTVSMPITNFTKSVCLQCGLIQYLYKINTFIQHGLNIQCGFSRFNWIFCKLSSDMGVKWWLVFYLDVPKVHNSKGHCEGKQSGRSNHLESHSLTAFRSSCKQSYVWTRVNPNSQKVTYRQ